MKNSQKMLVFQSTDGFDIISSQVQTLQFGRIQMTNLFQAIRSRFNVDQL
jgi:hypothetical protein